jgi:sugar lactone lactonase YvrE
MPRTLHRQLLPLCLIALLWSAGGATAADYGQARSEIVAAYGARDYGRMRAAAQDALDARPGYPGALFNLALAETLDGDADVALQTLQTLARLGVDFGVEELDEFAALRELPGWNEYLHVIESLRRPLGDATLAYTYDAGDFVPEGIAIGGASELYLGSIRHGTIVKISDGVQRISDPGAGHWSVFGMRLDARGGLWFASAAIPEFAGSAGSEAGRTGLFRLDLQSHTITDRALLPDAGEPRVLGDLVLAGADTIYTTESLTGALYRYSIADRQFTEILAPGVLSSSQGLVMDRSGGCIYVADYVGGLFRVSLQDRAVQQVRSSESLTLYGIDGLYRHGDELVAIQNGIRPNRIVAFTLAEDGLRIEAGRVLARNLPAFDEPTLGAIVGDDFYFVANSHWNRFAADASLPDDLAGPIVLRISLPASGIPDPPAPERSR